MAPTNSTLEVHTLMWCPFPRHLWQICLGYCWMKWLLSLQNKTLAALSRETSPTDDADRCRCKSDAPPVFGAWSSLSCSAPGVVCLPPRDSPPSPVARRGRRCPVHYLGHGHHQRLQLRAEVADCRVEFLAGRGVRPTLTVARRSLHAICWVFSELGELTG